MIVNTHTALKRIFILLNTLCTLLCSQTLIAGNGHFFNVTATGSAAKIDIVLCLNGKGPYTCQKYSISALNLKINTLVPNHQYPAAGIKISTPGYAAKGCVPSNNGYCLFSVNDTTPTNIIITPTTSNITASVSELALSVNCLPTTPGCVHTNSALSGKERQITFTNKATIAASNVSITSLGLPPGTTMSSSTCDTILEPNASCVIKITPGKSATSNCTTGITPAHGTITMRANDGIANQVHVLVLSYGCIYQEGYVYSIDDTTPSTRSIGGKVTTRVDQAKPAAPGKIWSSNSLGAYDGGVSIWGIDENSTTSNPSPNDSSFDPATKYANQLNCNGAIDGACNTNNIYIYYSTVATPAPSLRYYAAGLCKATINGHSDWYLPAICELGPDDLLTMCIAPPLMQPEQNIMESLPILWNNCTGPQCLAGYYWSSTELSGNPPDIAWTQCFATNGSTIQCVENKDQPLGVRCSRALTF